MKSYCSIKHNVGVKDDPKHPLIKKKLYFVGNKLINLQGPLL